MKKIVLYPNPDRDRGLLLTKTVCGMLEGIKDVEYRVIDPGLNGSEIEKELTGSAMMITFGGDGTILHAARFAARLDVPILGINTGNKGFMAELERTNTELLLKAVAGDCRIERRMMLDTEVVRNGETVYSDFALNDVVISGKARLLHMTVKGDGQIITGISGDGVVIATPTGSTAYSMAAGGPIMEPSAENMIITPICAHEMSAKAFVLLPKREVEVQIVDEDDRNTYVSSDGGDGFQLCGQDCVRIKRSRYVTKLIRVTETSFYEKVAEKLRK